ncbi:hypothetical protein Y032_0026g1295 [Ancylostoma ceylanicum]|uniref:Uncharacterized protein n=1 Tax=Ancylostoma ceylanicum TaxID=53326 RepID=A0A016UUL3_9BILA|nr:hypothetical protein Y032_0026g1295 [Ancylostoma ceylanicum]
MCPSIGSVMRPSKPRGSQHDSVSAGFEVFEGGVFVLQLVSKSLFLVVGFPNRDFSYRLVFGVVFLVLLLVDDDKNVLLVDDVENVFRSLVTSELEAVKGGAISCDLRSP